MKARYIELAELANALAAASLSTERGPLVARLDEGQIILFDFDGKEVVVIRGTASE